jgi:hypothetical protein
VRDVDGHPRLHERAPQACGEAAVVFDNENTHLAIKDATAV